MEVRPGTTATPAVSERLVARIWEEQHPLTLPLTTTGGEEIQVVYRGRRRWDRGPDFAGALIAWPGARLRSGEVEVHVRSTDWWAHGHHRDPRYNRVILQAVLWDDAAAPAARQDGVPVPAVALASHLSVPLESLLGSPPPDPSPPIPCWAGSAEDGNLAALLDRSGGDRLAAKAARFEADLTCASPDQLLYRGVAVALGYSQNRLPFGRLADRLPLDRLLAYRYRETGPRTQDSSLPGLEALLLGTAGLLPSQRGFSSGQWDGYARELEARWAACGPVWAAEPMDALEWEFFRVRPANFPTRRIAALAGLVHRWPREGMAELLAGLVCASDPRSLPRALEAPLLLGAPHGYWAGRCDFDLPLRRPRELIGRQRAAEIAVNVFLPFLIAWSAHRNEPELAGRVWEAFRLYPKRGDNELSRYVAAQVTGQPRPRVARSACRQQGLLHLYWGWCEAKRCWECPIQVSGAP